MLIEQIMNTTCITMQPTNSIAHAVELMQRHQIRHILVVNARHELVGLVGLKEIQSASSIFHPDTAKQDLQYPVSSIMIESPITAHPLDFLEDAAVLFYEYRLSCLPIVRGRRLVGIVTETDLLRTFVQLTGALEPSSQIEIRVENTAGTLAKISALLAKTNINILNVLVYPTDDPYVRIVAFRVQTMNPIRIIEKLRKEGFDVLGPDVSR
ncbi:acetoin utilization AcuB family protein [Exiguobacterium acetylicum]|uniref:acetoin utilization AcuB family protein n=1 Tax=Exiguobacterium TaxID=33986 RepID=UPI0025BD0FBE|nr:MULTISPECIES: acetoin utilization AcuB family protein [Exiguobacterium]MDQ6467498.1 acetoin utilization AcuB family protein [Exiguobacterium acetylicum]